MYENVEIDRKGFVTKARRDIQSMGKVIAVGIDGAPWELVNRFSDSGSIPNIAQMVRTGVSADLRSSIPPVTAPAWKCYSTGKNPGKLGAFWWTKVNFEKQALTFTSSVDFKSRDYWDYISDTGEYCVQINMPMTYPPPKEFSGVFVSGVPALENDDFTYPKGLKEELLRKHGWRITHESEYDVNPDKFIASVSQLIDKRFDLAEEYIDRADFMHLTIFFIDDVQHYTWSQMKMGKGKHADAIETLWAQIDRRIGKLRERAGPDHHMVIFSDHGFTDLKGALYINEWLGPELIKKKAVVKMGKKSTTEKMLTLADRTHLTPILKRMLPANSRKRFQEGRREEELDRREFFVWDETKVYGSSEGPVYINRKLVADDQEYDELRKRLVAEIEALVHPDTGEPAIEKVYTREEAYQGPYMDQAPDLIILPALGYEVAANVSDDERVWATPETFHNKWTGIHRMEGILIINGPEIREGHRLDGADIYDVAPTILALKGMAVPDDMDGRVLVEAMTDPDRYKDVEKVAAEARQDVEHKFTEEEEAALQDRLRSLGYM
jgi:predicted AlkP superfamily phosphohydrolase/phosphomutase